MSEPAADVHPVPISEHADDVVPTFGVPALQPRAPLGVRVAALIEVVLCSGFPTQLLLIVILSSAGLQMRTETGDFFPPFVFALSLLDAALVVGLVCFFIRSRGERIRDVLLGARPVLREALIGVLLVPLVFLIVALILAIVLTYVPGLHNVPENPLEAMLQTPRDAAIFSVVVMVAGGFREEVQRGFIVHRFDRYLGGAAVGVVVYSLAFGLGHLEQGRDAAVATGLLGAVWGSIYMARRSILAPVVSHAGFNLLQLLKFVALR